MAGLSALFKLLKATKGGHLPIDEVREVGRYFRTADPGAYFKTTKTPATDLLDAEDKYGVELSWDNLDGYKTLFANRPGDESSIFASLYTVDEARRLAQGDELVKQVLSRFKPDSMLFSIDAMGSAPNTGFGKQAYPALFDVLGKDAVNISTGLTDINKMRRSFNTADALIRNPALYNKIIPEVEQLEMLRASPLWYLDQADKAEKLGSMILGGSLNAAERIGRDSFKGLGQATMRKLDIVDQILSGETPAPLSNLGLKTGGLARTRGMRRST